MSWEIVEAIIGRAIVDAAFRRQLLANPQKALHSEPLTGEEQEILFHIHASSLDDFSQQVIRSMRKARDADI